MRGSPEALPPRAARIAAAGAAGAAGATAAIVLAAALALAPFLGKPVHVDDPMYLWAAQRIREAPLDFYGLDVNWHAELEPMAAVNYNPPLVSYYLAGAAALVGWSEPALHAAMALPALAALLAVARIARRVGVPPAGAALATLATPAFLVSATTLMADVLMLSLGCVGLAAWMAGIDRDRTPRLAAGAALVGLAVLAKYPAVGFVGLLAVYGLARRRRVGAFALALAIPLVMAAAYALHVRARYGIEPFGHAGALLAERRISAPDLGARLLTGLLFAGGALLAPLALAPWAWSPAALARGALLAAAGTTLAAAPDTSPLRRDGALDPLAVGHAFVFLGAALHLVALAVREGVRPRDPAAGLLAAWLLGYLLFASFVNWTTSARALLLAAPAAALLAWRAWAHRDVAPVARLPAGPMAALAVPLAVALAVAAGDLRAARAQRDAARDLFARHAPAPPGVLWFQGTWGFQWYLEQAGGERVAFGATQLAPGYRLVTAIDNVAAMRLPPAAVRRVALEQQPSRLGVATLAGGAGFYSSEGGALPWVAGRVPGDRYLVEEIVRPVRVSRATPAGPVFEARRLRRTPALR